ncbi:DUF4145 domain-containing protein [Photobacterium minamisatsumaniensis]|uniref:DUF4145 domain-containing protein n=1 Tax=Photobacterium minamisatsumaniensis TaxID=2910233 RepID=UPI003D14CFF8
MRYFDCTKFDYKKFKIDEYSSLIERDKLSYKHSFTKWVNSEIDNIVERKWEIENIGVVDETGGFIRLIKESELSYSIGAYYSTIALVGVACEDLCKYFADKKGYTSLIKKSQFERVNELKSLKVINDELFDKFDVVRKIRNDCLHFNNDFKSKHRSDLKIDALNCINNMKYIYKSLFSSFNGTYKKGELTTSIISDFAKQMTNDTSFGDTLNAEEFTMKLRYFMADEFNIDIAISDCGSLIQRVGLFSIDEIDIQVEPKELGLIDLRVGHPVIVDLSDSDVARLENEGVVEGNKILASLSSITDHQGITAAWRLDNFYSVENKI